jgi:hypothetical protein
MSASGLAGAACTNGPLVIGTNSTTEELEVWAWTGATWEPCAAGSPPPARDGGAVAFDPILGASILFGGYQVIDEEAIALADTHAWTGQVWQDRTGADAPFPRFHHALAADDHRSKLVLFGGFAEDFYDDVWEWDGALSTWTGPISPVGVFAPSARREHAMTFDSDRSRVVVSAGTANNVLADTWEWIGATSSWMPIDALAAPPGRAAHGLAYDRSRKKLVAFGGCPASVCESSVPVNDTWELDRHAESRPAILIAFDWASAHAPRSVIRALRVAAKIAGVGYNVGAGGVGEVKAGAALFAWNARVGEWQSLSTTSAASGLETVTYSSATELEARAFVDGRDQIWFAITSTAGAGNGERPPRVAVDAIDVEVLYQAPSSTRATR